MKHIIMYFNIFFNKEQTKPATYTGGDCDYITADECCHMFSICFQYLIYNSILQMFTILLSIDERKYEQELLLKKKAPMFIKLLLINERKYA